MFSNWKLLLSFLLILHVVYQVYSTRMLKMIKKSKASLIKLGNPSHNYAFSLRCRIVLNSHIQTSHMFTLTEALEATSNKPEFGVFERSFGKLIDYNFILKDTFMGNTPRQTLILKNLRGTCFDKSGKIISLSFDKFHNLNECDGWRENEIDFSQHHTVLEKLDGSMIRAIPLSDNDYRLGTRAGITDVAVKSENFLKTLPHNIQMNYRNFILHMLETNYTPIFEYCSRDQRIVIDYPQPQLILTAVRNIMSGKYLTYNELVAIAEEFELPVVKPLWNSCDSIASIAQSVRSMIGSEGVVVTFDNGFRVKIKADDYCLKHRTSDVLRFEKDVVTIILSGGMDDVLPIVDDITKIRLEAFRDSMMRTIANQQLELKNLYNTYKGPKDRKVFAQFAKLHPNYMKFLFNLFENKEPDIKGYILSKCSTQANFESIRSFIGRSYMEF